MSGGGAGRLRTVATTFESVDQYIATFPPATQRVLQDVRRALHDAVPGAGETISYNIPTVTLDDRSIVHFAGWKRHISLYPVPDGDAAYEAAVAPYRSGASTVKFPLAEPVPYDLVGDIAMRLAASHG